MRFSDEGVYDNILPKAAAPPAPVKRVEESVKKKKVWQLPSTSIPLVPRSRPAAPGNQSEISRTCTS
jgi:hypothetical protein